MAVPTLINQDIFLGSTLRADTNFNLPVGITIDDANYYVAFDDDGLIFGKVDPIPKAEGGGFIVAGQVFTISTLPAAAADLTTTVSYPPAVAILTNDNKSVGFFDFGYKYN